MKRVTVCADATGAMSVSLLPSHNASELPAGPTGLPPHRAAPVAAPVVVHRSSTGAAPAAPARARFGTWLNRSRRVLLTLWMVWVVSVFDFYFTLSEWGQVRFVESNPLAAYILTASPHLASWFKFGLLTLGTCILLWLRRHSVAELACWMLLAVEIYLGIRWFVYFESVASGDPHPMIQVELIAP